MMTERRRYTTAGFPSSFRLSELGSHVQRELVNLRAEDGGASKGVLYWQGARLPKAVVMLMHPRTDQTQNYTIPFLVEAGFAAYGQASRWVNNDIATVHETLLLDVAAGVRFLKEERGFAQVVFIGNSGGGSLLSFYQSQAATPLPGRLTATPAGDPPDLNRSTLIPADGMIFLAAHAGEGKFLMEGIDPSVTDEHDPLSCDPALDMYNSANGFRALP
ncbi:MAG: alpha/beta hydrolase, partial [Candidatus Binatia bacterium]